MLPKNVSALFVVGREIGDISVGGVAVRASPPDGTTTEDEDGDDVAGVNGDEDDVTETRGSYPNNDECQEKCKKDHTTLTGFKFSSSNNATISTAVGL